MAPETISSCSITGRAKFVSTPEQIARICDRHRGIGADGILLLENATNGADFRMRYYNRDGGEAEMCGNGARCFARFAGKVAGAQGRILFETPAGADRRRNRGRTGDAPDERSGRFSFECSAWSERPATTAFILSIPGCRTWWFRCPDIADVDVKTRRRRDSAASDVFAKGNERKFFGTPRVRKAWRFAPTSGEWKMKPWPAEPGWWRARWFLPQPKGCEVRSRSGAGRQQPEG